jgi:hypothetical protein
MTRRGQGAGVGIFLGALMMASTAIAQSGQGGWTVGRIDAPVPAKDSNGNGVPGCLISFGSPQQPDLPCAATCDGGSENKSGQMQGAVRALCEKNAALGRQGTRRVDYHPDSFDTEYAPGFGPPGSYTCTLMVGPPGYPNWTHWFPRGHPMCGTVTGDPHISTFDKVRYDLQAAGEFVAVASSDDDLQVQLRFEQATDAAQASMVTAAAARVGAHRVTVMAGTPTPLRLDGEPLALEDGTFRRLLDAGAAIVRTLDRYSVVWRDGTNLHVDVFRRHLNVFVLAAEARDGRLAGLLGNAGGDAGANDFRTRDGRALASPPAFADRHSVFAESWRVRPEESLFDYGPGQTTATFTRRDFPAREASLAGLDAAARAGAETRCRAAGVRQPAALDECVFDVAVTGDEAYIASARSLEPSPDLLAATTSAPSSGAGVSSATFAGVTVTAPREVVASFPVEVTISGPTPAGDRIAIARAGAPDREHVTQALVGTGPDERVVRLTARNESGPYEFRYKTAASSWRQATIRLPFEARDPVARLDAPDTAAAGGSVQVRCVGECSPLAYVNLVPAGSRDDLLGAHADLSGGLEVTILNLPKTPGEYEVRYLAPANPRRVFARRSITLR